MATRNPPEDSLPPEAIDALRRLAAPPRALPALVDARIRDSIERHPFRSRRRAWLPAARWAVAAVVAVAAGGLLGWAGVGPSPAGRAAEIGIAESATATAQRQTTIVDAMLAARIAEAAQHGAPAPSLVQPNDAALLARLDADHDGSITMADAQLLSHRAVRVSTPEGGS